MIDFKSPLPYPCLMIQTFLMSKHFKLRLSSFAGPLSVAGLLATTSVSAATTTETENAAPEKESEKPILFSLTYKSDWLGVVSGGVNQKTEFLGNLSIGAGFDFDALIGWKGASAEFEFQTSHGGDPSINVGDNQVSSNIEAPNAALLYQAFLQQNFADDRFSLLFGLHDLNSEFYVTDSSAVFLNSSFGVGPELAQTGLNGPSIFPVTSLAFRARAKITDALSFSAAVYDAVSGNPDDATGTHISVSSDEGFLNVGEITHTHQLHEEPGKISVGGWSYTKEFDHLSKVDANGDPERDRSYGGFLLLEQKIHSPRAGEPAGLTGFLRAGLASSAVNPVSYSVGLGVLAEGMIGSRERDQLGLGFYSAAASRYAREAAANDGEDATLRESIFELTYKFMIHEWVAIQPDVQWIIQPNMRNTDNAVVAGARLEIAL